MTQAQVLCCQRFCGSRRQQLKPRQRVLYAALHSDAPSVQRSFSESECEHLRAQIQAVIDKHALTEGRTPTRKQFQEAGQGLLLHQISAAGGLRKLAPRLNLLRGADKVPTTSVSDLSNNLLTGMYWEAGNSVIVSPAITNKLHHSACDRSISCVFWTMHILAVSYSCCLVSSWHAAHSFHTAHLTGCMVALPALVWKSTPMLCITPSHSCCRKHATITLTSILRHCILL